jgi:hypothetical protein
MNKEATANRKSSQTTVEEELEYRDEVVEETLKVFQRILPGLLEKLAKIPDPRQPGKVKHMVNTLMIYGILMFVFRISSRREANREMTAPILFENLKKCFPGLETLPHADTLARLLEKIDVNQIQEYIIQLVKSLIRKKKFRHMLIEGKYLIVIDGTQKFWRWQRWDKECLERHVGKDKEPQYYVYVLEAVLVFENGLTIPLWSEFLKYEEYQGEKGKQDCELKAFKRIAEELKRRFPKLKIAVALDGLYACGPVMAICRSYQWDYMIVLKDDSLKEVWREFRGLSKLEPQNITECQWNEREQKFNWVNGIEYRYGENQRKREILHVVVCEETWQERDKEGKVETKFTKYAWISRRPLSKNNVANRCNLIGRYRWKIENNIHAEKHQGYEYEHCFSYNWNAMMGYHYLMNIGRILNALAVYSDFIYEQVKVLGIDGYLKLVKLSFAGSLLNYERIQQIQEGKYRLRLRLAG